MPPPTSPTKQFYFAYGSNLWVDQMARRCPESLFMGKGTLAGYRWQINSRGVANVVKDPKHSVEGLVFSVSRAEVRTLDRNEGVSKRLYEPQTLEITLVEHPTLAKHKIDSVVGWLKSNSNGDSGKEETGYPCPALVYVSERFKVDGTIRAEYVERMNFAIKDAIALGVSEQWINTVVRPHIVPPPTAPPTAPLATPPTKLLTDPPTDPPTKLLTDPYTDPHTNPPIQPLTNPPPRLPRVDAPRPAQSHKPVVLTAASERPGGGGEPSDARGPRVPSSLTPLLQPDAADTRFHRELERMRRGSYSLKFPQDIQNRVKRASKSAMRQDEAGDGVYRICVSGTPLPFQPSTDSNADYTSITTYQGDDLDLSNEFAMLKFRELWSVVCPDYLAEGNTDWKQRANNEQYPLGLSWNLVEDKFLDIHGRTEASSLTVRVERQQPQIPTENQPTITSLQIAKATTLVLCLALGAFLTWRSVARSL